MPSNAPSPITDQPDGPRPRRHKLDTETEVIRAIATVELIKGMVVLLAGFGALSLIHRDVWDVAVSFLHLLHIKHRYHYADVFLRVAQNVTDRELVLVAVVAALYSTIRFVEAYGLWKKRGWAEWFAAASGALYLPFEINELFHRLNLFGVALLVINLAIVIYMLYLRLVKGNSGEQEAK